MGDDEGGRTGHGAFPGASGAGGGELRRAARCGFLADLEVADARHRGERDRHHGGTGGRVHDGRIEFGRPVGQPAVARPAALCRLHHADHLGKERPDWVRARAALADTTRTSAP